MKPPPAEEKGRPPFNGSNNWAVSGALTATGRALVSNDMHLGLAAPNIYYQARLRQTAGELRDVTGVTLPGSPFVVAGSNGRVAWGYTNSYGDWTDAVIVRPGPEPDTYLTPDGPQPFVEHRETLAGALALDHAAAGASLVLVHHAPGAVRVRDGPAAPGARRTR